MYILTSNIAIGNYTFKVHEVRIKKSLHSYMDTAVIKIPTSARLRCNDDNSVGASAQTASYFAVGDKVVIDLGYDGILNNEFTGFVSRINFTTPLEIECEGYAWQLRQKSFKVSFISNTVKKLLEQLIVGTDIALDKEMNNFDVVMGPTSYDMPLLGWLDYLKKEYYLDIYFKANNKLYAGLQSIDKHSGENKVVKHKLGYNVIKDDNLKEHKPSEVNVQVNVSSEKQNGEKQKITTGEAGGKVYNHVANTYDKATLQAMAEKKAKDVNFVGYEGKITTFLVPFFELGDISKIIDDRYTERGGLYLAEAMEVIYSRSGGRRIIDLGLKIG